MVSRLTSSSGPALCLYLSVMEREASKVLGSISFYFFFISSKQFAQCSLISAAALAKDAAPQMEQNNPLLM